MKRSFRIRPKLRSGSKTPPRAVTVHPILEIPHKGAWGSESAEAVGLRGPPASVEAHILELGEAGDFVLEMEHHGHGQAEVPGF